MIVQAPPPAAAQPAPRPPYGFAGATMGLPLEAWRMAHPESACASAKQPAGAVVCGLPDQPIGGGYRARDPSFTFIDNRLARIQFSSSVDGFAYVVARLKTDFGDPAAIERDAVRLYGRTLPHVAFRWKNGRSTIQLSDPVSGVLLGVSITLDTDAPRLNAS